MIAEVLACLLDGKTITQRESYERFSTVNIARTIFDLRHNYGWPVITTPEESHTRDGRIARYARYSLAPDVIARHTDPAIHPRRLCRQKGTEGAMSTVKITIPFHGKPLVLIDHDEKPFAPSWKAWA